MRLPSKLGVGAVLIVLAVPVLARLPELTGHYVESPMSRYSGIVTRSRPGFIPGVPELDPNSGLTSEALGRRAAATWMEGEIPWWNSHEGVGVPLAGEMNSAAFFPLVLLQLLPKGHLLMMLALQMLAGLGSFLLLRRLSMSYLAAITGGILFGFNGAMAWLTHSPANPMPFLPFLLLGVEQSFHESGARRGAWGVAITALSLSLSLVAGFPEVAYLNGLVAVPWTGVRLWQSERKRGFLARIAGGLLLGLMLAAPVLVAFAEYLLEADVGGHHSGQFANAFFPRNVFLQAFLPYIFGPPRAFIGRHPMLFHLWGGVGGYLSVLVAFAATVGVLGRRERALRMALLAWTAIALGKTYGAPGIVQACNLLPFVKDTAWYRYAPASWELATCVLAAFAIDDVRARLRRSVAARYALALAMVVGLIAVAWVNARAILHGLQSAPDYGKWRVLSVGWPALALLLATVAVALRSGAVRARVLAAVLCIDAVVLFMIPRFSAPSKVEYGGMAGVRFLQQNLGLQRFYTLGPIVPNYGAYFGIASLNHDDLPIAARWIRFIREHLLPHVDPVNFIGAQNYSRAFPSPASELIRNLDWYEWAGVKYVVASPGAGPAMFANGALGRLVHSDGAMTIFELPSTKPYFEVTQGTCLLSVTSRTNVRADCQGPAQLVRRELFFPGWSATANGTALEMGEYGQLFQRISLPAGTSQIRFSYRPVHGRAACWGFVLGLFGVGGCLAASRWRRERSRRGQGFPSASASSCPHDRERPSSAALTG